MASYSHIDPVRWAAELQRHLDSLPDLSRRDGHKFAALEKWVASSVNRRAKATYVSSIQKQYTARVGQALAGLPQVMVLLCSESWAKTSWSGKPYVTRLEALVRYATGLEVVIACVGQERQWMVEFVVGLDSSGLRRALAAAIDERVDHPVDMPL